MSYKIPKRTKFRKSYVPRTKGFAKGVIQTNDFALRATSRGRITQRQIEAMRVTINRSLGKKGRINIMAFPQNPVTSKPLEVRMGKGKGGVDFWAQTVKPGQVLFELSNVNKDQARRAFSKAAGKTNLKVIMTERQEVVN